VQLIYQPPDAPGYGTARPGIEYNPLSEIFIVLLFYMYESRYVQYSTFVSYCVTVYSRKEVLAGLRHLRPNPSKYHLLPTLDRQLLYHVHTHRLFPRPDRRCDGDGDARVYALRCLVGATVSMYFRSEIL
jgi:hypothetical protein